MNCANHPETPASVYCQFCGKPLCDACAHRIANIVGCEPCMAARVSGASVPPYRPGSYAGVPPAAGAPSTVAWGVDPWIAFGLGWIPGVGAMYNGQLAKALAHVIIFALLVDLANYNSVLGILIAAWVIYQVFDAYQTALARRNGLPLPNPLGLNDIGQWFGAKSHPAANSTGNPMSNPTYGAAAAPPAAAAPFTGPSGFAPSGSMPPVPPNQYDTPDIRRGVPTGAVVLIVLGVLFLLGNMGIMSEYWWNRGWPIILIVIGVWLVIRRSQRMPPGGAQ